MGGESELQDIVARIRALDDAPREVAKIAAPLVEAAVKKTAAAGTSPDGAPWPPRKDGSPALANAADAVTCTADGSLVQLRLEGTSTGSAQVQAIQNAKRPILPLAGAPLPKPVLAALRTASQRFFDRTVKR